jgi:hypothetical protein
MINKICHAVAIVGFSYIHYRKYKYSPSFYIHIGKCVLWSILFCLIFEILASLIYIIDILNNPIYLWYYYIVYIPRTALMFNVLVLGIFLLYDVMRLMKII